GFTLVELLIVTVALGLLAVFASNFVVSNVLPEALQARGLDAAAQAPEPPPSPAAQLVRRAGLAVLLFGAGFWYLAELRRPGCLDRFRLGQFLLLALTFSLFFVAFAVLHEQQLPAAVAAGGAVAWFTPYGATRTSSVYDFWLESLLVDDDANNGITTDPNANPHATGQTLINTLIVVDVDGDGKNDIIATLDDGALSGLSNDALVLFHNVGGL
ncbi:MAG: prepilin-type N-terminal cleavage/methylation domain-containing protein, partial [Caldilineaceae bacterium]|nr:prepilin-type N-terminal cleavage/methylation domain-containing protein [Caldilineaceae bacterium]